MSADIAEYLNLITSEHNQKPDFLASVAASVQPFADASAVMITVPILYDLDTAIGAQLDVDGQWIGLTRNLTAPLNDVYFSFDIEGLGFDQGTIWSSGDPVGGTQLITLADDAYRLLLKARVIANKWDGTVPDAYTAWNELFGGTGIQVLIQDNGNGTMYMALQGAIPDAVTEALFTGGYLPLKPAGGAIEAFVTPTVEFTPLFAFDCNTSYVAGFDVGAIAEFTYTENPI